MNPESKKHEPRPAATPPKAPADKLRELTDKLVRGTLDLTVEEVEERIHPSETNVFDK